MSEKRIRFFSQVFPPKPTWTAVDVPNQAEKVVIITGGSGGIGQETARVSARFLVAIVYCFADYEGVICRYYSQRAPKCISRRVHKKGLRRQSMNSRGRQERSPFSSSSSTWPTLSPSRLLLKNSLAMSPSFMGYTTTRMFRARFLSQNIPHSNVTSAES